MFMIPKRIYDRLTGGLMRKINDEEPKPDEELTDYERAARLPQWRTWGGDGVGP